jgi:hypothetical protein
MGSSLHSLASLGFTLVLISCGYSAQDSEIPKEPNHGLGLAAYRISAFELNYLSNAVNGLSDKVECTARKAIKGFEPDADGRFPVLLYFTGSWAAFDSNAAMEITKEAASQGFVAATVEYQNNTLPSFCNGAAGTYKLRCIFSGSHNAESAVSAVCSRPKADCDGLGIVLTGFSQGGAIAAMGRNWDPRIRGAWTMGYGDANSPCDVHVAGTELGSSAARVLDNERIRFFRGLNEASTVALLNRLSGRNCPTGATSCLNGPAASGWFRPLNTEITADLNPNKHCFFQANGKNSFGVLKDCATPDALDPKWVSRPTDRTFPHSVFENVQWLKNSVLPLGPQR